MSQMVKTACVTLLLVALTCLPAFADAADFENATFGMTRAEVIAAHPDKNIKDDGGTLWYGSMESLSGESTSFSFSEAGRFYIGAYIVYDTLDKSDQHLEQFRKIKDLATQKYGAPLADKETWHDETFKDMPDLYGMAVASGALEYAVYYKSGDTIISIELKGQNYGPHFTMMYIDSSAY